MTMFKHIKYGDHELSEPVEMPETTRKILTELLEQNRRILEANCTIITLISMPSMYVRDNENSASE